MRSLIDQELRPEERLQQVASILAIGVIRLRQRVRQNSAELTATGLELSPDTVLSVTNPVNGRESPTLGAPA